MWGIGAAMAADRAARRLRHVHGVLGRLLCSAAGEAHTFLPPDRSASGSLILLSVRAVVSFTNKV